MLGMEHRISDDIDLFIRDPQWIGYLTPRLNDKFEHLINSYDEGATSLKLKFNEGEIDFIVSMSLLGLENKVSSESLFPLERSLISESEDSSRIAGSEIGFLNFSTNAISTANQRGFDSVEPLS